MGKNEWGGYNKDIFLRWVRVMYGQASVNCG